MFVHSLLKEEVIYKAHGKKFVIKPGMNNLTGVTKEELTKTFGDINLVFITDETGTPVDTVNDKVKDNAEGETEGDAGKEGETGEAGTEGTTEGDAEGEAGDAGKEGETEGKAGEAGTEGATGEAGTEGDAGANGTKGEAGEAGKNGKAPVVTEANATKTEVAKKPAKGTKATSKAKNK